MARIEITEALTEIACTLDAHDLDARLAEWRAVLDHAVERTDIDGGVRVRLAGVSAGDLADLAEREQRCCSFFTFNVIIDGHGVALEARAPADARAIVTDLLG